MPFLPTDQNQQDDDKDEQAGQATQGQILSSTAGGATAAAGQSASATQGAQQPKATSSGSFTNLNNYLTANKGNDGVMGKGVGNMAAGKADNAAAAGTTYQDGAKANITGGTLTDTKGLTSAFTSAAPQAPVDSTRGSVPAPGAVPKGRAPVSAGEATTPAGRTPTTQAPTNLTSINADDFSGLWNGGYTGQADVKDFEGYAPAAAGYKEVQDLGQMAGGANANMDSRGVLLDKTYGNGQKYQTGEKTLDSFILGAGDEGVAAMKGINDNYGNYNDQFTGITDLLAGDIAGAQKTSDATRDGFREAVQGTNALLGTEVGTAQKAADAANASNTAILAELNAGYGPAWQKLGIDQNTYYHLSSIPGFDPKSLITGSGTFTAGDKLDSTSTTNYAALQALLGGVGADTNPNITPAMLTKSGATDVGLELSGIFDLIKKQELANQAAQAAAPTSGFADAYNAGGSIDKDTLEGKPHWMSKDQWAKWKITAKEPTPTTNTDILGNQLPPTDYSTPKPVDDYDPTTPLIAR